MSAPQELTYDQAIGAQLRAQRLAALVKQSDLAAALHVTRATVTRWEQGTRSITGAMLLQIADVLGIPATQLLPVNHRITLSSDLMEIIEHLEHHPHTIPIVQSLLETLLSSGEDA